MREGDRCTKFFHASVLEKHHRLAIMKIKDDHGHWLDDADAIQNHAVDFFTNLFASEPGDPDAIAQAMDKFLAFVPSQISTEDNLSLLRPITSEEVKSAVFALDPDSALGSDGFPGRFYQSCWDIIASDLLNAVEEFFVGVPIPKGISSTLMVLLPKKPSPTTFGDFRPISLCNFINKVFTRILCDCLRDILPRLISEEQSAFVRGRDISDNVLMAREMLSHLDRRTTGNNVMFKLDMMKAFDRVSWSFLQRLLEQFGFHARFTSLIINNLKASRFSVLINGSSAGFFQSSRCLQHEQPEGP